MYEVYLARRAQKEIEKLSPEAQDRVLEAIDGLMEDPDPHGARKIKGDLFGDEFDYYRIRLGTTESSTLWMRRATTCSSPACGTAETHTVDLGLTVGVALILDAFPERLLTKRSTDHV